MTATVSRHNISVKEVPAERNRFGEIVEQPHWEATLRGQLSTREHVSLSRPGGTFQSALANLESIINQNGWTIL